MQVPYITPIFLNYMESRKGNVICHPCAYGVFCASVGISKEDALLNYLYAQTSAMVTNCVKSIPLSQSDGQKMLVSFLHSLSRGVGYGQEKWRRNALLINSRI